MAYQAFGIEESGVKAPDSCLLFIRVTRHNARV